MYNSYMSLIEVRLAMHPNQVHTPTGFHTGFFVRGGTQRTGAMTKHCCL